MANGDLVFSHVPADNGALLFYSSSQVPTRAGQLLYYQERSYWWVEVRFELDVTYSGAAWDTSKSPFQQSFMNDWVNYMGMYSAGTYDEVVLYGFWGVNFGSVMPTTSDGVCHLNSSNTYPFNGGRYSCDITFDAQKRFKFKFGSRQYWYELQMTQGGVLGYYYSNQTRIDCRGAQYSTRNGYDGFVRVYMQIRGYPYNPACPHQ